MEIPKFSLFHGQVLWALSLGQPAPRVVVDQVRRLRQLGVPFGTDDLGTGPGHRAKYRFEHLVELALAVFGLRRGLKPTEVANILGRSRSELRRLYRRVTEKLPVQELTAEWVKSRGRIVPLMGDEVFVRLHDRYAEQPGTFDVLEPGKPSGLASLADLAEHYPGERARTLVPLTRLIIEMIAWAKEAPETRPGPKVNGRALPETVSGTSL